MAEKNELEQKVNDLSAQIADYAEQVKTAKAEADKAKADLEKYRQAEAAAKKAAQAAQFAETAGKLVESGRLMPRHKQGYIDLCTVLADNNVEFSEGDNKKEAVILFQEFISALVSPEDFSEVAKKTKATDVTGNAAAKLERKIREIQDLYKIDYSEAFRRAQKENPELAKEYSAEFLDE